MAKKLFVGGLSWDTDDTSLSNFFSQAGTVVSANVVTDKFSGRSKGFGFVEMETEEEAEKAKMELNGQMLDGRTIAVDEAKPQEPRDNRSGGFNRGGNDRNRGFGRGGNDRGGRDSRRSRY
jgi:RNA recognition motif-containing protein